MDAPEGSPRRFAGAHPPLEISMNSNAISKGIVILIGMFFALRVTFGVLAGGGNAIGNLAFYLLIACGILGVIAPKMMFFALVLMTMYLDTFKRLLVAGDQNVGQLDLYYVLGVAPVTLMGIAASLIERLLSQRMPLRKGDIKLVVFGLLLAGLMGVAGMATQTGGGVGAKLRLLANEASYLCLIFVVPLLFRTPDELRKLLRFVIAAFVPVALYTFYHSKFGITNWEYKYLLSGLTLEVRQLDERVFRPFSTMNSAAALSVMMAIMAVLSLAPLGKGGQRWGFTTYFRPIPLLLAVMFVVAAFLTYSRGGWICGFAALFLTLVFRFKAPTMLIYPGTLALFLIVMFSAESMIKANTLGKATDFLVGKSTSNEKQMAVRLGTFTSRLVSLEKTATNPKRWTPFGVPIATGQRLDFQDGHEGDYYVHDGFSYFLIRFGYIPLGIAFALGSYLLYRAHRFQFSLPPDSLERNLVTLSYASAFGIIVGFMGNTAQLQMYPVNFYLYLFIAIPIAVHFSLKTVRSPAPVKEPATAPDPSPLGMAGRRLGAS